jgi:hypothetical protein
MIEDYIDDIDRRLVVSTRQRTRIIQDIRDHLADAVGQLAAQGIDVPTAELQAVAAFGAATDLASQFNGQAAAVAMRRTPITMAACGAAVVAGFLLAAITQPSAVVPPPASSVQQVAFFTAVLGLEFAFVAGLRLSVRAAACWRATPGHGDQLLLRRAMAVFGAGLAVAAGGWTVVMADVLGGSSNRRTATLVAGMVMMIGAAIVAGIVLARQHPHGQGEPWMPESVATDRSILGAAERAVRWIGVRPRTTCAVVAIVAGLGAMANADTTVGRALPWGIVQAAAVVAGFVLLGPALQLRATQPMQRPGQYQRSV